MHRPIGSVPSTKKKKRETFGCICLSLVLGSVPLSCVSVDQYCVTTAARKPADWGWESFQFIHFQYHFSLLNIYSSSFTFPCKL